MAEFVDWVEATAWAADVLGIFAVPLAVFVGVGVGALVVRVALSVARGTPQSGGDVSSAPSVWSSVDAERGGQ